MAVIVDPDLIANLVSQLNIKGPLAPFEVSEVAIPVFDIGRLTALDLPTRVGTENPSPGEGKTYLVTSTPRVNSGEVNDDGFVNGGSTNDILADTGQLTAGDWLVWAFVTTTSAVVQLRFQRRNAANDGDKTSQAILAHAEGGLIYIPPFVMDVATDERFRFFVAANFTGLITTTIWHANVRQSVA